MKKIILFVVMMCFSSQVYAITATHSFEDVFITYVDESGYSETNALNVLTNSSDGGYLYKIYFGEVSTGNYNSSTDEFLKLTTYMNLNQIVYHQEEINPNNESRYYYAAQYIIFETIFTDYEIYFSDSSGNKLDLYIDEIEEIYALMEVREYDIDELYIYNNYVLSTNANYTSVSSNLSAKYDKTVGEVTFNFLNGDSGFIELIYSTNEGVDTIYYINSDNNILFEGGGVFYESNIIDLYLQNTSTVASENPGTGINPYLPIIVGVPLIICGGFIYYIVKEKKSKKKFNQ